MKETKQRPLESHFSEKSLTPQERKNLVEQVRVWKLSSDGAERLANNYGSQLADFKSRAEKAESSVLCLSKDYADLKIILGEKDVENRQCRQRSQSFEKDNGRIAVSLQRERVSNAELYCEVSDKKDEIKALKETALDWRRAAIVGLALYVFQVVITIIF